MSLLDSFSFHHSFPCGLLCFHVGPGEECGATVKPEAEPHVSILLLCLTEPLWGLNGVSLCEATS